MVWYSILISLWELFNLWGYTIFVTPFINLNMLWILVPVWLSWFFAEFFQEKTGTSMGNAISNATIVLWAAIDCARQTVHLISAGTLTSPLNISLRFLLLAAIFTYGMTIVVLGWKGNPIIRKIGRIREMTYVFAIFVPVFYNQLPLTFNHVLVAILFFPLFYYAIELLDHITPNPKAIVMDEANPTGSSAPKPNQKQVIQLPNETTQATRLADPSQNRPPIPPQNQYPPRNPPIYPKSKSDFWNFNF